MPNRGQKAVRFKLSTNTFIITRTDSAIELRVGLYGVCAERERLKLAHDSLPFFETTELRYVDVGSPQ